MSSPASPRRTNTLVITRLPPQFFEPIVQQALRSHFETYGPLYAWAPIKGLARVIMVYYSEVDAETAKESNDGLTLTGIHGQYVIFPLLSVVEITKGHRVDAFFSRHSQEFVMRVYRADPTPIETSEVQEHNHYLRPPANEKNFLISPPGSPPVGWEQIREDPPNSTPLAQDLIAALRRLEIQEEQQRRGAGPEVLLEPEDGVGISVFVEDCDATEPTVDDTMEEDWVYGETAPSRLRWRPTPTSMPPVSVMG